MSRLDDVLILRSDKIEMMTDCQRELPYFAFR